MMLKQAEIFSAWYKPLSC